MATEIITQKPELVADGIVRRRTVVQSDETKIEDRIVVRGEADLVILTCEDGSFHRRYFSFSPEEAEHVAQLLISTARTVHS